MADIKQQPAWLFYSKRVAVLLLLGALYWGFTLYRNYQRESELSQMRSKAELVAKLGVSDAIHDDSDSLRKSKRDSILNAAGESAESLDGYIQGFEGSEDKLAIFWTMVDSVGDSLVKAEFARMRANDPKKDTSATQR